MVVQRTTSTAVPIITNGNVRCWEDVPANLAFTGADGIMSAEGTQPPTQPPTHPPTYPPTYPPIHLLTYLPTHASTYPPTYPPT